MRRVMVWLRARPLVFDLALVAYFLWPSLPVDLVTRSPWWLQVPVVVGLVGPLLIRRHRPGTAVAVVLATIVLEFLTSPWGTFVPIMNLTLAPVLYSVAVYGRRRQVWLALAGSAVVVSWWAARSFDAREGQWREFVVAVGFVVLLLLACWLLGEFVSARRAYLLAVEDRAARAEREKEALARAAVAEERTRIAREMHDVVAHAVSMMVMQAEGARMSLSSGGDQVEQALRDISRGGRDAMGELRRMLHLLRREPTGTAPQPTGADLRALVDGVRAAGLTVELDERGGTDDLPAGLVVQVVRIVQEALTNVLKHAVPPSSARVVVDWGTAADCREVRLSVRNTAASVARGPLADLSSGGHGLAGMRERVAMYGGTVSAERTAGGGFAVEAVLPVGGGEGTNWA
ncbi:sensor histidine kinase [Lentzea jiangxiensis]|uniref:histidine kinase n=1 Tax=Lentzea jiangxiensis TaxID=641025 RepID=A0A1H0X5A6_9PSEU|nr:histidine kinase [Lentzea jiangxiensis]SDP98082.1 Signal transduction histidine kinase [Lentzea jiangxiensis]